ncbi:SusC/RagA family TonB-linked outer membrane protein [Rufibacter glacialis]|uniref:SusC/RagA family TonB-linked outer membrane protein n=1 Tax=Rufibacter glacialis TaxID=1259555 RepID=A0A5M8QMB1_9BACT|nr:TonB-dependent receptor [Rufibacter glacialis]KAA6437219.1 TonB-dependent receptor [Rufibacter glacialis]GGK61033.1 SusC/RagA family TonB-linked outer membrane protein [Rufibacter glacialis]
MKKALLFSFVLLLVLFTQAWAQTRTVTGRVTDAATGEGMPGVTVQLKESTSAVPTDVNGSYSIGVPNAGGTLIFTFIGYTNKEVVIGTESTVNVRLVGDAKSLNEVVVVAYGTADPATFTGSVAQIGAEKLAQRPVTNITNAIAGQAAGVQVSGGSGQPGSGPDIRIRGFSSVNYSNDPLYVVDGVPFTAGLSNINMEDVESISILKDAASTALYGSRATNGVVMITTKRGKKDRIQVNVRALQGVSSRAVPEYDRVSAFEYYPLMWEAYRNSLIRGTTTKEQASQKATNDIKGLLGYNPFNVPNSQIVLPDGSLNPSAQLLWADDLDWEKALTRDASRSDYTVSFNGGSEKSDYYVSLGYLDDKGYLLRSDFERFSGRMNVNSNLTNWFKAGVNMNYTLSNSNQASTGSATGFVNPFFFSRGIGPIYPIHQHDPVTGAYVLDANGQRVYDLGGSSPTMTRPVYPGRHIVAETEWNDFLYRRNVLGGRTYGEITFLKDFKLTGNFAVDITNYEQQTYENTVVGDGAPAGRAGRELYNLTSFTANQLLNYSKTVGGVHVFDALLGHENFSRKFDNLTGSKSGEIVPDNTELQNFGTTNSFNTFSEEHKIESYFGRANYTFDEKYTLSGSYRRDGSSRFYKDVRWGSFWSVGASWRLDNETFFTMPTWIDMVKLRASYGQVGNENIGDYYAWQALYTLGRNNAAEPGFSQATLGNRALVWEKNNSFDVGVEFALFSNRLNGTVEFFNRESEDLLFEVKLPLSTGVDSRIENIGAMYNRGIELRLAGDVIKTNDFTWNLDINWTTFKNELTKLPYVELVTGTKKYKVGEDMQAFWLREFYGVDPDNGNALYRAINYNETNSKIIGSDTVTFLANNARYHYAGSAIPDFSGGITNTFTFKGFSLSALITYSVGGKFYDSEYAGLMNHGTYGSAMHRDMLGRWQNPGDNTRVPRLEVGNTANLAAASDRWLNDASYLNFRSVSLNYNIPAGFVSKLRLRNVNVFATGENLGFITKRKGMNVAQNFNGTTSAVYVPSKNLSLGINLSL